MVSTKTRVENPDPILNLDEAAEYIGVTPRWMRRWREEHDPRYPVTKRGRLLGWKVSVLKQYLDDQTDSDVQQRRDAEE